MKKFILSLSILFILIIGTNYSISSIKADSGFDSGFDSGSSSWSSDNKDWNPSSYNDYKSVVLEPEQYSFICIIIFTMTIYVITVFIFLENMNTMQRIISFISGFILGFIIASISYFGPKKPVTIYVFVIEIIILLILLLIVYIKNNKELKKIMEKEKCKKLSNKEIKNIDENLDVNKFNEMSFQMYKTIQSAWMNFDLATIRNLVSDEIYNMYSMQLETLKVKNQQNIMNKISCIKSYISEILIENNIETVKSILKVTCYDYIINNNGKVIRGNKYKKNIYTYKITFERNLYNKNITNCPNCGKKININSSGKCNYCNSTIINKENNWIMTKKEMLNQK